MNSQLILFSISALVGAAVTLIIRHYVYKPNAEKISNPILRSIFGWVFHGFNGWVLSVAYVQLAAKVPELLSIVNMLATNPIDAPISSILLAGFVMLIEGMALMSIFMVPIYFFKMCYHIVKKLFQSKTDVKNKDLYPRKIAKSHSVKQAKARS